jgi:hypothetical protein
MPRAGVLRLCGSRGSGSYVPYESCCSLQTFRDTRGADRPLLVTTSVGALARLWVFLSVSTTRRQRHASDA